MKTHFPEIWDASRMIYGNYLVADSLKILFVLLITPWLKYRLKQIKNW
jgi:hypothetical protein